MFLYKKRIMKSKLANPPLFLAAVLVGLTVPGAIAQPAPGQPAPQPPPVAPPAPAPTPAPHLAPAAAPAPAPGLARPGDAKDFQTRLKEIMAANANPSAAAGGAQELTRFDLDFSGGTVRELVAAIEKGLKRPLNVIVPEEFASTKMPALKMANVRVQQLFQALGSASRKLEAVPAVVTHFGSGESSRNYKWVETGFSFEPGPGALSDDTIWTFRVEKPAVAPEFSAAKVCRFYSLASLLDRQLTVEDITTAIETGWKMLGDTSPPMIKFHKDTKLLIAVGEPDKLELISAALRALGEVPAAANPAPRRPPVRGPGAPPKSGE